MSLEISWLCYWYSNTNNSSIFRKKRKKRRSTLVSTVCMYVYTWILFIIWGWKMEFPLSRDLVLTHVCHVFPRMCWLLLNSSHAEWCDTHPRHHCHPAFGHLTYSTRGNWNRIYSMIHSVCVTLHTCLCIAGQSPDSSHKSFSSPCLSSPERCALLPAGGPP